MTGETAGTAASGSYAGIEIERTPLWIPSGGRQLWGWLHQPATGDGWNGHAVVICNPVGHELIHAYRSVRHLADAMARSGFAVLRFDYSGTGDSEGDQLDEGIVESWLTDVQSAVNFVRQNVGARQVHLVGIRSGALFAAASFDQARVGGSLVLWDPIASGKRFVRELRANSRLAYFKSDLGLLEALGYPYSETMQKRLRSMDVAEALENHKQPVLLLTREQQPDAILAQQLAKTCAGFAQLEAPGLEQMLIEPHLGKVPFDAIDEAVGWLKALVNPQTAAASVAPIEWPAEMRLTGEGSGIVEAAVEIGRSGMFGIYCRPDDGTVVERPIILFGNAGSIYHIGPNRLYVTLARKLAQAGYASIRYDLANIGDGLKYPHTEENYAYPVKAIPYITEVIEFSRQSLGHQAAILTGFCSGATQSFVAALAQPRTAALAEIMMVNPKVFYKEDLGKNLENLVMRRASYYQRAVRDRERWKRLFRGDIDFRQLATFVSGRSHQLLKSILHKILTITGGGSGTRLGDDLESFLATGRKLTFFFSSRDPGYTVLLESSGGVAKRLIREGKISVTTIEDADHTLISKRCRDDFTQQFIAQVTNTYPRGA